MRTRPIRILVSVLCFGTVSHSLSAEDGLGCGYAHHRAQLGQIDVSNCHLHWTRQYAAFTKVTKIELGKREVEQVYEAEGLCQQAISPQIPQPPFTQAYTASSTTTGSVGGDGSYGMKGSVGATLKKLVELGLGSEWTVGLNGDLSLALSSSVATTIGPTPTIHCFIQHWTLWKSKSSASVTAVEVEKYVWTFTANQPAADCPVGEIKTTTCERQVAGTLAKVLGEGLIYRVDPCCQPFPPNVPPGQMPCCYVGSG